MGGSPLSPMPVGDKEGKLTMRRWLRLFAPLLALGLVAASCGDDGAEGGGGGDAAPGEYPRHETLYTSGGQWGPPSNWNPIMNWMYTPGTIGLVYETLFLYDPVAGEYIPWLAESGEWVGDNVYELRLREGVTWADGEAFDSADVVFTVELGQMPSVPYAPLWEWLETAEAVDAHTVRFTFSDPRYQQWANWVYFQPIVPEHLWRDRTEEDVTAGANENPVGTGPYRYLTHSEDRMVWEKRDGWWAEEALGLEVKPRYLVDIVNPSNEVALGLLLQGQLDLSNNFLPGINEILEGDFGIVSYYDEPPYMLAANTTWLVPNTTREPLDDPQFRRALAFSINIPQIVEGVYGNIVAPADPTGLLPVWDQYIDRQVVDELGFSYDPDEARRILSEAGYEDGDGDGFVETPDGDPIELEIIVPSGWTDWMEAARVIAESASAVGINVTPAFPDYNALVDVRGSGDFDLLLNNERQVDVSPWHYYDYMFQLPIRERQSTVNFGRYENEEAWELVEQLDDTPIEDPAAMLEVTSQLQEIHLTDMPIIPLWYNGMWSQASTQYWTNWPAADPDAPGYVPTTWRGYFQRGAVLMLTELEPVGGN